MNESGCAKGVTEEEEAEGKVETREEKIESLGGKRKEKRGGFPYKGLGREVRRGLLRRKDRVQVRGGSVSKRNG